MKVYSAPSVSAVEVLKPQVSVVPFAVSVSGVPVANVKLGPVSVVPPTAIVVVPGAAVSTATPFCVMVPDAFNVPPIRTLPLEATRSLVDELFWKLMKSADEVVFAPRNVPEAFPPAPVKAFGPIQTRAVFVLLFAGTPLKVVLPVTVRSEAALFHWKLLEPPSWLVPVK